MSLAPFSERALKFIFTALFLLAIVLLFSLVSCSSPSSRAYELSKAKDYSQAVIFCKDSTVLTVNFPHGEILCKDRTRSMWRNTRVTVEQREYGTEITKPIITAYGRWNEPEGLRYDPETDLTVRIFHGYLFDFEKLTPANDDTLYDR